MWIPLNMRFHNIIAETKTSSGISIDTLWLLKQLYWYHQNKYILYGVLLFVMQ